MSPSPMAGSFRPVDRIMVPVQGTDREFEAQQWAVEMAAALGLRVHAVHVATDDDALVEQPFAFLEEACRKWGVELGTRIVRGTEPARELVLELRTRDLVVIGTRHLSGTYHVGSVTEELVQRAPCPVVVVRLR